MSIDYRTVLAQAVSDSHYRMQGATPDMHLPPNAGDLQVAHDLLATRIPDLPNAPTIAKVLAVGHVMLEANGDLSRFADPELLPADHVKVINSMLAYIIEVDPSRLTAFRAKDDR